MKLRSPRLMLVALVTTALAVPLALAVGSASAATKRAADPTAGWTPIAWNTDTYKVQNWTKAPMKQRFTITNGVYNINVHSGEKRVEMRWDGWKNQRRDNMWEADVLIDAGSTATAIMQIKSNKDGEPIYVMVYDTKGNLRNDSDHTMIAAAMYGKWFNLKCAFNPATGIGRIWIDNVLVKTRQYRRGGNEWYFKNGAYNNGLPRGAMTSVHFKNIKLWRNDRG
jgi:hypothetical protein